MMVVADLMASIVLYGTDGDASGEYFAIRNRLWITARSEDEFLGQIADVFAKGISVPGSKAEVDMISEGGRLLWASVMPSAPEGFPLKVDEFLGQIFAGQSDIEFMPECLQAIRHPTPGNPVRARYDNPPTVVVMLVETDAGLLIVRRGLADGYGKLALPGGHQVKGETWQEAGAREVREETGLRLDPAKIRIQDVVTVPSGHNLLFARYEGRVGAFVPKPDRETLEVLSVTEPIETAFPTHTAAVADFFRSR